MENNKQHFKWIIFLIIIVIIFVIGFSLVDNSKSSSEDNSAVKTTKVHKKVAVKKKPIKKVVNKRTPAEEERYVEGVGQAFGQKDSQSIQKYVGSMYQSVFVDGLGMTYTWKTSDATYIRVDNTDNGITMVYLYDDSAENHLGRMIYQGETIKQMAPRDGYGQ
ncbi:hypothetical protein ACFQAV_08940 [Companilactobacillus huachuanensis]|uniref:DUF1310 family protein n=1 Tax=Companilactobacillus huachuanensis TaxID=2559914 RepID=A0ABW1RLM1_9LACO|nr:hypothetical protein [Companilactobacillus huachuanensis]